MNDAEQVASLRRGGGWSGPAIYAAEGADMADSLPRNFLNLDGDQFGSLRLIDIPREVAAHQPWFNETLTTVNDAVIRLGIFEGDFPWHKHDDQDEFFLVLDGEFYMDVEGAEPLLLRQHQGFTVPKGTVHRPRSPQKSVVLMVEAVGIVPTGD